MFKHSYQPATAESEDRKPSLTQRVSAVLAMAASALTLNVATAPKADAIVGGNVPAVAAPAEADDETPTEEIGYRDPPEEAVDVTVPVPDPTIIPETDQGPDPTITPPVLDDGGKSPMDNGNVGKGTESPKPTPTPTTISPTPTTAEPTPTLTSATPTQSAGERPIVRTGLESNKPVVGAAIVTALLAIAGFIASQVRRARRQS
jgi:hypothetical protein